MEYLEEFKESFINYFKIYLNGVEKYKTSLYLIAFLILFFLYFSISIPQMAQDSDNMLINFAKKMIEYKIIMLIVTIFLFIGFITTMVYIIKHIDKISEKINNIILYTFIFCLFVIIILATLTFNKELFVVSQSIITKYVFYIFSYFFYFNFALLFISDIIKNENNIHKVNKEFFISIEIIILFYIYYIFFNISSLKKIYYQLKNYDYSTLSINCFPNSLSKERFYSSNGKDDNNYLKTIGSIPIAFFNKTNNNYQDLILADFYYPGSYYSYLSTTPLNGIPNLEALKITLSDFKCRIIHLDIFSDKDDNYNPNANPVVRCEKMSEGAKHLNLLDCFGMIKKWGFIKENPNDLNYPLFLYLKLHFKDNESLFIKINQLILKVFSAYLVDKKYSFAGRNGKFPISKAAIKDCLGKIIIISDTYPTKSALDENINGSSNDLNYDINIRQYKESYVNYPEIGLSQDFNKNELVNSSKLYLNFFYSEPNEAHKNNNQEKAGLYNPNFQDCAQYGIQSTLMYVFVPDENLNLWRKYFKNKNNYNPVLKDELLRMTDSKKLIIEKQNPVLGLQIPQKYCVIPGLISTEKSNLTGSPTNNTCN
jgi:hypothetical protein